jgi:hypothetical protein
MKIISKRKDYYDYLGQIYGVDDKVLYRRDPRQVDGVCVTKLIVWEPSFNYSYGDNVVQVYPSAGVIWFCGQAYLILALEEKWGHLSPKERTTYYYSFKELDKWKPLMKEKLLAGIEKFFATPVKGDANTKHNSPQIVQIGNKLQIDPILKDYQFQRVISPEQAFQRVSMFVSAKPDVPQTVPTDMHRFEAKGFSKKTSFRNM